MVPQAPVIALGVQVSLLEAQGGTNSEKVILRRRILLRDRNTDQITVETGVKVKNEYMFSRRDLFLHL